MRTVGLSVLTAALLFSNLAFADKIVLLSSLRVSSGELAELEGDFKDTFSSTGFDLQIIRNAHASNLKNTLSDPEVVGVFWISHAAGNQLLVKGFEAGDIILDEDGDDVKNVFTQVGPSLKYLGMIGCQAKSIMNGFKKNGYFPNNLFITSFKDDVEVHDGLSQALDDASQVLTSPSRAALPRCSVETGVPLLITRTSNQDMAGARVDLGDGVMAFFPPAKAGENQQTNVVVPAAILKAASNLNFKVSLAREYASTTQNLGELGFSAYELSGSFDWSLFATANGTPIGDESELYVDKSGTELDNAFRASATDFTVCH